MPKPIAPAKGIAFAFPDICNTPAPPSSPIPIPYPNIAQLADAQGISNEPNKELKVGGDYILLKDSMISSSTGDEAGSAGPTKGTCKITQASATVVYGPSKKGIARFLDTTEQNGGNAVGMVLGTNPTVMVGD